eukprot:GHVL01020919.1.p1 GENE.GHVL01020919.1~~GHVL01020919.1.p1  ORF type:complete len:730 (+),score=216.08 GHVL01020919.1:240-2429(+)
MNQVETVQDARRQSIGELDWGDRFVGFDVPPTSQAEKWERLREQHRKEASGTSSPKLRPARQKIVNYGAKEDDLNELNKRLNAAQRDIEVLQHEASVHMLARSQLDDEISAADRTIKRLQKQVNGVEEHSAQIRRDYDKIRNENDRLLGERAESDRNLSNTNYELNQIASDEKKKRARLENELNGLINDKRRLESELLILSNENKLLQRGLEEERNARNDLRNEQMDIFNNLDQEKHAEASKRETLEMEVMRLKRNEQDLNDALNRARIEGQLASDKANSKEAALIEATNSLEGLKKLIEDLRSNLEEETERRLQYEADEKLVMEKYTLMEDTLEQQSQDINNLHRDLNNAIRDRNELEESLDRLKSRADDLKDQNDMLTNENSALKINSQKAGRLGQQLEENRNELDQMRKQIQDESQNLANERQKMIVDRLADQTTLQQLRNDLENSKEMLKDSHNEHDKLRDELDSIGERSCIDVDRLNRLLNESRDEAGSLARQNEKLKKDSYENDLSTNEIINKLKEDLRNRDMVSWKDGMNEVRDSNNNKAEISQLHNEIRRLQKELSCCMEDRDNLLCDLRKKQITNKSNIAVNRPAITTDYMFTGVLEGTVTKANSEKCDTFTDDRLIELQSELKAQKGLLSQLRDELNVTKETSNHRDYKYGVPSRDGIHETSNHRDYRYGGVPYPSSTPPPLKGKIEGKIEGTFRSRSVSPSTRGGLMRDNDNTILSSY